MTCAHSGKRRIMAAMSKVGAAPDVTATLEAPDHYHLTRTLAASRMGRYDPTTQLDDAHARLAIRTPDGPASLSIRQSGQVLTIEGWGEGAGWLMPHVPRLTGLSDDPSTFEPAGRVVRDLKERFSGMRLPVFPRVFDRVVRVTLLQVVTWQEACRAWGRMVRELGSDAPGPLDVRLPPTAEALRGVPDYELMAFGIRPKQARTIRLVAKHAKKIERAALAGHDAFAKLLAALPGIGPWTIAYVQGTALGHADAVLLGDYNLPDTIAYVLTGEERAPEERMLELLEPYRGHRFRVIRLIWLNGVSAPRRGPRYDPE